MIMESNAMSYADFAAMNNGGNNWMNNPFMYLIWMMFFSNGGFGINGNNQLGTQAQVQNLSDLISDNHNNDLTMQAINGNTAAITQLAGILNTSTDAVTSAINAMSSQMQMGMCGIKSDVMAQGYQNQLANCQQTNTILQGFNGIQNSIANLGTSLGYQVQTLACEIKSTSTTNTQRIIDTLNAHWSTEQQGIINSLNSKVASMEQTQTLLNAINAKASA